MFDIAPAFHNSVSRPWLRPPGNCPVVDLYGLSVTLPFLSYTVSVLFERTFKPVLVNYQDTATQQAIHTNRQYLKGNRPVVNITDLTFSLPIKEISQSPTVVSVISQQDKLGTHPESCKQKPRKRLQQQTSWELCRTTRPHFTGLLVMKSVTI